MGEINCLSPDDLFGLVAQKAADRGRHERQGRVERRSGNHVVGVVGQEAVARLAFLRADQSFARRSRGLERLVLRRAAGRDIADDVLEPGQATVGAIGGTRMCLDPHRRPVQPAHPIFDPAGGFPACQKRAELGGDPVMISGVDDRIGL